MTIKALYPTVRPTLNLDFAKTKALDPRVTFSRASTGTFVGSNGLIQTAASGAARFDHNPTTGESLGLLVEEARTNYTVNSLTGHNYSRYGIDPAIANTSETTSPDGTNTARLYVATGSTVSPYIQPNISRASLAGLTSLTVSVYVKIRAGFTGTSIRFASDPGADNSPFVGVTWNPLDYIDPPAVVGSGGTSARVVYVGNGWFRCSASYSGSAIVNVGTLQSDVQMFGNGTSTTNGFYLWGEQIEAGSFPTSYIPTTGSTVTRAADVASMTGTNFSSWYNQSQGTVFSKSASFSYGNAVTLPTTVHFTDGTLNNYIRLNSGPSYLIRNFTNTGNVNQTQAGISIAPVNNTPYSIALGISTNNARLYANTNPGATINPYLVPVVNKVEIGNWLSQNNTYLNGHIARLAYYPVRLPDAQLQALTAT